MIVPEGWHKIPLSRLAIVQTGLAKGNKKSNNTIFLPYLRVANVQDGYLDLSKVKHIEVDASNANRFMLEYGDVLLTEGGDFDKLGRGCMWREEVKDCLHQNHIFAVRTNRDVLIPLFLSYQTGSSHGKSYFLACSKQSTNLASINSTQLKGFPVLLPPVDEQKAIVDVIFTWDRAIEKTEALIAAKERRKKWLMQQLLTGRVRFGECGAASRDGSPKDWFTCRIEDVCKRVTRKNTTGETHVLTASGENGLVDQREYFNRAVAGESLENYYLLKKGEFAYNRSSMNGYPYGAIKRLDRYDAGILSTLYICFAVRRGEADSDFLQQYFDSPVLNKELREITQIGARAHGLLNVSAREFMRLKICIPGLSEQQRIATCLGSAAREIICLRSSLATLKEQKKGLMQQLLTGKVRVKVN